MKAVKLSRTKVLAKIEEAGEDIYTVHFIKKDLSKRKMKCKQGVEHNLVGGTNKVVKDDNAYLSTFDIEAVGYRTINLDTIYKLKVNGVKYEIV